MKTKATITLNNFELATLDGALRREIEGRQDEYRRGMDIHVSHRVAISKAWRLRQRLGRLQPGDKKLRDRVKEVIEEYAESFVNVDIDGPDPKVVVSATNAIMDVIRSAGR